MSTIVAAPAALIAGPPGQSAYALAVMLGFVGTPADWLQSLKVQGDVGAQGPAGPGVVAVPQTFSGSGGINPGTTYAGVTVVPSGGLTLTLAMASVSPRGFQITIADETGNCSTANPINVNANGADTVSGQTGVKLIFPYQRVILTSTGASLWIGP